MLNGFRIPNDLSSCQSLLAELAARFAAEQRAVENYQTALKSHESAFKSHELTIGTHELTIASLNDRLEAVQKENAEQKLAIDELLRRAFEKRSERYLENPDQLGLDFGNTAEAADAAESLAEALEQAASASAEIVVPEHTRRKHPLRKPRSEQLPPHLPRYEVEAPPTRQREELSDSRREEVDRSRPAGDVGVRAAEAESPCHVVCEVRLRKVARMRRD